uniref:Uncharacterized protein n=1 Tax=Cherry rusty mottle associated virus TaxID=1312929 RepID=W6JF50_9VIRU|nr:hypothetical protein [Cherry rusty mottle associated virus]
MNTCLMLTLHALNFHLVSLLLCMVCLVAGSQLLSSVYWIVRILTLSLTVLLSPQIWLGVVLKKLYSLYNPDSTFLTSICLDLLTRVLICCFPILIRTSANHLLLISSIVLLIGLVIRFVNTLTY